MSLISGLHQKTNFTKVPTTFHTAYQTGKNITKRRENFPELRELLDAIGSKRDEVAVTIFDKMSTSKLRIPTNIRISEFIDRIEPAFGLFNDRSS